MLTWALCALLGLATTAAAQNGEQSRPDPSEPGRLGPGQATNPRAAAEQIAEGNKLLDQGDYRGALSAYDRAAEKLPDAAEVPYNRGVALYRMGEFEKAGQAFQNSLKPGHPALEARAKYNLGRCAHAAAMQKHDDLPAAINELSRAIGFYGDAMQLAPQDEDARKNQQLAQRLREYLRRRLEEQKKENPTSQPSSQPSSQPTSQPSSQPTSQPQQGEQQQGDQQEQDSKGEEKQDQAAKDQKQQGAKGKEDEKDKDKEGAAAQEEHKYTPEEAEKRLQEAREMERQRREELRQEQMHTQGRVRVQKDW